MMRQGAAALVPGALVLSLALLPLGSAAGPPLPAHSPSPTLSPSPGPSPSPTPDPSPEPMPSPFCGEGCLSGNPDYDSYIPQCDVDNESVDYCPACAAQTLSFMELLNDAVVNDTDTLRDWTSLSGSLDSAWAYALATDNPKPFLGDNPDDDPLEDQVRAKERELERARADREQMAARVAWFELQIRKGSVSQAQLEAEKLKLAEYDAKVKRLEAEIEEKKALIRARDARDAKPPRKKAECLAVIDAAKAKKKQAEADRDKAKEAYDYAQLSRVRLERMKARIDRLNENCPRPIPNPVTEWAIENAKRREEEAKDELDKIDRRIERWQKNIEEQQKKCDLVPPD